MKRYLFPPLALFLASSCSATKETKNEIQNKELRGWGDYEFGMSFEDAITANPSVEWNSVGLRDCIDEISINGCFLPSDDEKSYLPLVEGISYKPNLTFTKKGLLQSVSLGYSKEGNIDQSQCLDIFERSVDWVSNDYGNLSSPKYTSTLESPDWTYETKSTALGNSYRIGVSNDGAFVTTPLWSNRPIGLPPDLKRQLEKWESVSHLTLDGTFLTVDSKPICSVSIGFEAPKSVNDYKYTD